MLGTSGCEEKILVSVRLRPLNEKEITKNDVMDWECINHNTIILRGNLPVPERSMYPSAYTFDNVFRWDCSTRQVYEEGTKGVALSVVSGINSSVFAYGQTSSGKTYTMRGITEYTIADIYDYMHKHKERKFLLKFSAMEIYNESVRDLLSPDSTPLRLLDDPERGTIVEKLTEETPKDWNHLKELLSICEAQRQIGETSLNEMSSRSHQILRLTMESSAREFLGNDPSTLTATVSFVDLAGSERASQALSAGSRLKEGCHINRSLLTLGTVIRKLSKGRTGHVPFRDSKLTRILQSSLGGNARTAIICTMSPARTHVEQSRNTLLFASCAKEVSTNAQVNVVMSDKALVKHLQREVARLENELKNYGKTSLSTDSVALLRQKDLQIVELRKEISELILERDLARSQVEESLHEEVDLDNHYPELRVQRSWDYENSISDASASVDLQSLDIDLHEKSEDTERHSRTNSEETYLKLPKFEDNFQQNGNSPRLSIDSPDFGVSDICNSRDKVGGTTASSPEILCKDVRCIEVEETNANRYVESSISSPESNSVISAVTVVHNGNKAKQDIISPPVKADREILHIQRAFIFGSPGELSPWILAEDIHNSSKGFKLKKSRSCKANLMGSYSSPWFEDATPNESTPQTVFEKDFIGRPEGLQKFSAMDHAHNGGTLSRICSQTSAGTTSIDECEAQNIKTNEENAVGIVKSAEGSKEMVKLQMEKQPSDVQQEDAEGTANESTEDVKDVRSDLIHDDVKGSSDWPAKFMRLRGEIIEFWHACNVSLVHRTYFFLLFKGDPTDSIYMEVEYRRLSFLRDTFARGNQTMEDGRTLSPASSAKALHQEREMLVRQMQKRLTEQDRENLYLKFGIKLNSKNRRFQLAYRLWSDTKDMDHITDSANIVAKLVGFVEPQQAFREMFGLNFAPWRRSRRLSSWRRGMVMSFS